MNNVRLMLLSGLWFLSTLLQGQTVDFAQSLPSAPADHVLDVDGAFRGREQMRAEISESLVSLQREHGFPIYLVVFMGLIGSDVRQQAETYHRYWLGPKSEGAVMVVDIRGQQWIAWERSQAFYTGAFAELGLEPRIEHFEIDLLFEKSVRSMVATIQGQENASQDELKLTTVKGILTTLSHDLKEKLNQGAEHQAKKKKEEARFLGWMALFLLGLALLGLLVTRFVTRTEERAKRIYQFPNVLVGTRLGANYGGGKISCGSFGSGASDR